MASRSEDEIHENQRDEKKVDEKNPFADELFGQSRVEDTTTVRDKYYPRTDDASVVLLNAIAIQDGQVYFDSGSGVVISRNEVATNYHVLLNDQVTVKVDGLKCAAQVEKVDPANDLAILEVYGCFLPDGTKLSANQVNLQSANLASRFDPSKDQVLTTKGYAGNQELGAPLTKDTQGRISTLKGLDGTIARSSSGYSFEELGKLGIHIELSPQESGKARKILLSTPGNMQRVPGDSGGAVINRDGKVVGIITRQGRGLTIFTPIEKVIELAQKAKLPGKAPASLKECADLNMPGSASKHTFCDLELQQPD